MTRSVLTRRVPPESTELSLSSLGELTREMEKIGLEVIEALSRQRYSSLTDSGWVSVSPRVDSVLVTLGDIAQVCSNGKTKKVRGRLVSSFDDSTKNARCISMLLSVTLPLESTVSPLLPRVVAANQEDDRAKKEDGGGSVDTMESKVANSFSFEDYAWRLSPAVAPRPSSQRSYYSELAKQWHLGGNDGPSWDSMFFVATTPSSGAKGFRARSVMTADGDLRSSKTSVERYPHRAPTQGITELTL
ncbi:2-oxoglutarate (2OG) and Fe(II)-dependent oxygenase superfamily protein [Actinidia rufa]|uniref:2-oxoglutarate (2OG) and Fe(II)-dependent oxygenase superfamily protein n=1 Tax=Actinidia rufa TaxID=165716 RepID=A0A7J0EAK5_9ERIC|nr:2-oxoglutarate (2OG) and Fe(II)-dependent oxygenase superfamily protein [Actinidia rufa]